MKPRPYVQLQAFGSLLAALAILVVLGHGAALALAVATSLGAAVWLGLAISYRVRRARRGSHRSDLRASRDRIMIANFVIGLLAPSALAWLKVATRLNIVHPPLHGGQATILALSVAVFPLSILVSSSVDWYLIRPFREGVFGEPACRAIHAEGQTTAYARYWVMHRMVSEFLCYAAVVAVIAIATVIAHDATHSTTGQDILTVIGPLGIAAWSLKELSKLLAALQFVRYPTCGLGEWISGRNAKAQDVTGFVLDTATDPGVQLIDKPRGFPAKDISVKDKSIPLSQRETIVALDNPPALCPNGRCEFWVPDCEIGLRQRQDRLAQHDPESPVAG